MISKITILGTGALACLFGARLAPHAEVVLLGSWPQGLAAIRRDGIRLNTTEGETRIKVRATDAISDAGDADLVLILVKSWQTDWAVRQARQVLQDQGLALTLQNGLGHYEALRVEVGESRAVLGVTTQGATLLAPGHVRFAGGGETLLGYDPVSKHRVTQISEAFSVAGFPTRVTSQIETALWGKLAVNAGINPLTALLGVTNGGLLDCPDAEELMVSAAEEAAAVAAAHGLQLEPDAATRVRDVARLTASNRSSMLQDIGRGAPTEIEAISGAVVRSGRRLGVPTPVNKVLWKLVRALRDAKIES